MLAIVRRTVTEPYQILNQFYSCHNTVVNFQLKIIKIIPVSRDQEMPLKVCHSCNGIPEASDQCYIEHKSQICVTRQCHRLPMTWNREDLRILVSKGWGVKVVKRHSLRATLSSGEAGSRSAQRAAKSMARLKAKVGDFALDSVFNVDEMGRFIKLQPKKIYEDHDHHSLDSRKLAMESNINVIEMFICLLLNQITNAFMSNEHRAWLNFREDRECI